MNYYVEIVRTAGRSERHALRGAEVTLGRSPSATISLADVSDLAPVHILFAPRPDGCWVSSAKGSKTSVIVAGKVFESGVLPWGSEMDVGTLTLVLRDAAAEQAVSQDRPKMLLRYGILFGMVAAGYFFFFDDDEPLPDNPPADVPELFAALPDTCPAGAPAEKQARDAHEAAVTKAERYPYEASDGIEAVKLFRAAQRCFAESKNEAMARRMEVEFSLLKSKIEEDYLVHRVRQKRALKNRRLSEALVETRALLGIVDTQPGPYKEWLVRLERHLLLRVSAP